MSLFAEQSISLGGHWLHQTLKQSRQVVLVTISAGNLQVFLKENSLSKVELSSCQSLIHFLLNDSNFTLPQRLWIVLL